MWIGAWKKAVIYRPAGTDKADRVILPILTNELCAFNQTDIIVSTAIGVGSLGKSSSLTVGVLTSDIARAEDFTYIADGFSLLQRWKRENKEVRIVVIGERGAILWQESVLLTSVPSVRPDARSGRSPFAVTVSCERSNPDIHHTENLLEQAGYQEWYNATGAQPFGYTLTGATDLGWIAGEFKIGNVAANGNGFSSRRIALPIPSTQVRLSCNFVDGITATDEIRIVQRGAANEQISVHAVAGWEAADRAQVDVTIANNCYELQVDCYVRSGGIATTDRFFSFPKLELL